MTPRPPRRRRRSLHRLAQHRPVAMLVGRLRARRAHRAAEVWEAARRLGPTRSSLLFLHLRHGLRAVELADELGCRPGDADRAMDLLRHGLARAARTRALWQGGRPRCAQPRALAATPIPPAPADVRAGAAEALAAAGVPMAGSRALAEDPKMVTQA